MATDFSPPLKETIVQPPKRGQIKAQIFESLVKSVTSMASKAGEPLGQNRAEAGGGGGLDGNSASTFSTPLLTAYNSDDK
ncbi:Transcriptional regulator like [Quillaja saponaria]|uniref:Transcriptional regulator like n=1 Tax=Quillaja saponaria TaxID=32244 RepID=A0AAD7QG75_QUISA|nr:Transcriptional regulator like [Quillaja saponaria]